MLSSPKLTGGLTSHRQGLPATEMQAIIDQTLSNIEPVISDTSSKLPADFPQDISEPVFEGMRKVARKLIS